MKLPFLISLLTTFLYFHASMAAEFCPMDGNAVREFIGEGNTGLAKAKAPANNRPDVTYKVGKPSDLKSLGDEVAYVPRSSLDPKAKIDPSAIDPETHFIRVRVETKEVGVRNIGGRRDITHQDVKYRVVQVNEKGETIRQSAADFADGRLENPLELPYIPERVVKPTTQIAQLPADAKPIPPEMYNFSDGDSIAHVSLDGHSQTLKANGNGNGFTGADGTKYKWENGKLLRQSHKLDSWNNPKWVQENGSIGLVEGKPVVGGGPAKNTPGSDSNAAGSNAAGSTPPPPPPPKIERANVIAPNGAKQAVEIQYIPNSGNFSKMTVTLGNGQRIEYVGKVVGKDGGGTAFLIHSKGGVSYPVDKQPLMNLGKPD